MAAPIGDRSRSSNYFSLGRMGPGLRLESRKLGKGIVAWGVHGFPADCVLFALMGPMRGQPPDLVVSGVNSGPNLGVEWFFSGTIGAARTAAFLGVPAIAVSGLDDSMPGAIKAVNRWVVALARSPVVRDLEPGQYLTVSFPEVPPSQIVGVRVVPRAALDPTKFPTLDRVEESTLASEEWRIQAPSRTMNLDEGDEEAFRSRFIAVVPMRVGEQDHARLMELQKNQEMLPSWPP